MYDLETPALLLHLDVVERNVRYMSERARQLGVALRPHAKTHKCVEVGRLQLERGARGLTVSTLVEAEVFTRAGFDDVTWAFPIDPSHIPHARRLAEATGATLRVTVDDESTARALAGSGLHVWLKVDSGLHRAGVDPASPYALRVAAELGKERGLVFDGLPILESAKALPFDDGVMDEDVLSPVLRRDETKPLLIVEPLDLTGGHRGTTPFTKD